VREKWEGERRKRRERMNEAAQIQAERLMDL
jgi:hypothetical protein